MPRLLAVFCATFFIFSSFFAPKTFASFPSVPPQPLPPPNYAPNYSLPSVIFIHGLGGYPWDWYAADQDFYTLLMKNGWPVVYLRMYAYSGVGPGETYNYQGALPEIVQAVRFFVEDAKFFHQQYGGTEGDVVLVGYSLGGLIAREYLRQYPQTHGVKKIITIGTPHQGVDWLRPESFLNLLPLLGPSLRLAYNTFWETAVLDPFLNFHLEQPIDLNSPAVQQIIPGSSYLNLLNGNASSIAPQPIYDTIYGDIDAEFRQKIFFFELKKRMSLGDGVVLKNSAVGIPLGGINQHGFSDQAVFEVKLKGEGGGYEFSLDALTPWEVQQFRHDKLLKRDEIQSLILRVLSSN